MRQFKLIVQYDGTQYRGFQLQPDVRTIQGEIEDSLARVLNETIRIHGAGRTDAGVHAIGQVIAFTTSRPIPADGLLQALNDTLPDDICVARAERVNSDFHPQYDAVRKQYRYRIHNRQLPNPFVSRYTWHVPQPLDIEGIQRAATHLVGRHDFSAFEAAGSTVNSTVRELFKVECRCNGDEVEITADGDGFLYRMMRIIAGTLVEVGLGKDEPSSTAKIMASKDRTNAGPTAPARGLFLVSVWYE